MSDHIREREKLMHDLSNHLGIVIGFIDLVLETVPKDDPRHADLQESRNAAAAGVTLVNRLTEMLEEQDPPAL